MVAIAWILTIIAFPVWWAMRKARSRPPVVLFAKGLHWRVEWRGQTYVSRSNIDGLVWFREDDGVAFTRLSDRWCEFYCPTWRRLTNATQIYNISKDIDQDLTR